MFDHFHFCSILSDIRSQLFLQYSGGMFLLLLMPSLQNLKIFFFVGDPSPHFTHIPFISPTFKAIFFWYIPPFPVSTGPPSKPDKKNALFF